MALLVSTVVQSGHRRPADRRLLATHDMAGKVATAPPGRFDHAGPDCESRRAQLRLQNVGGDGVRPPALWTSYPSACSAPGIRVSIPFRQPRCRGRWPRDADLSRSGAIAQTRRCRFRRPRPLHGTENCGRGASTVRSGRVPAGRRSALARLPLQASYLLQTNPEITRRGLYRGR